MAIRLWLIDKSALLRLASARDASIWAERLERGLIRVATVKKLLANQGRHRAPSVADLLVAATAELAGLSVLHLDKDFELIAEVTGQPLQHLEVASSSSR